MEDHVDCLLGEVKLIIQMALVAPMNALNAFALAGIEIFLNGTWSIITLGFGIPLYL